MINIIIADHEPIFRTGAARLLAAEDDLRIISQPQSAFQMLHAIERLKAHVLLVPRGFLPALPELQERPAQRFPAVIALAESEDLAVTLVARGAKGVIYRSIAGSAMVEALRRVASGGTFIHCPHSELIEIHSDTVGARVVDRLSDFELLIVDAIFRGRTNHEIAQQFGISVQAVKNAITSIFDKVGVSDRLELVLFVYHHRMLDYALNAVRKRDDRGVVGVANRNKEMVRPFSA